jgi:hypothetical protein
MEYKQYREVAYILGRMIELIPDIQDQFNPEEDEQLADMITKAHKILRETETYALRKGLR